MESLIGTGAGGTSSFDNEIYEAETSSTRSREVNDDIISLEQAEILHSSCAESDKKGKKFHEELIK